MRGKGLTTPGKRETDKILLAKAPAVHPATGAGQSAKVTLTAAG